jgi:hypothetical protein
MAVKSVIAGDEYIERKGGDMRALNKSFTGLTVTTRKNPPPKKALKPTRPKIAKAAEPGNTRVTKAPVKVKKVVAQEIAVQEEEVPEMIQEEQEEPEVTNQFESVDSNVLILAGFKNDWSELNQEFQNLPIVIKTQRQISRKSYLEKQLSMIEENIRRLSRRS